MPEDMTAVGKASEIADGEIRSYQIGGEDVAIAKVDGSLHAFGDVCTHAQCLLSEGDLDGTTVTCPCHASEFDVTSGAVLNGPATEPVPTYPLTVDGDDIRVAM